MAAANTIGTFIIMEEDRLMGFERTTPHILVDLDLFERLPMEMDINWDEGSFVQKKDYWKVAFRCHCCGKIGHSNFFCLLFGKHPRIACHVLDAQEPILKDINFPIPLDKAFALEFIGKFT